ncbi:MAG: ATP-binding protein [Candidatus Omnitrophota bacterium]
MRLIAKEIQFKIIMKNNFPQKLYNLQTIEYLWRTTIVRFIIATIILTIATILFDMLRLPIYKLIAAIYLMTIIYLLALKFKIYLNVFAYIQVIFDLIIITNLIYYTGSVDSILTLVYPLIIIEAGLVISPRSSTIVGFFAGILYTLAVVLEFLNIFPQINPLNDRTYLFSLLYFKVTVFCTIGFLSAYLTGQLRLRSQKITVLETKLKHEERLSTVGKLAAAIAHEIRNPLACISGAIDTLSENLTLNEENQTLMNLIIKESARLNNIISGLLEYVRPKRLKKNRINFDELCEEVIALVKNNKEFNRKVTITKIVSGDAVINCDFQKMQQVILNLLINALEAMPEEGGSIFLNIRELTRSWQINISDQGQGISGDKIDKIFEPFFTDKPEGVGLGLSIVLNIIEEHNGTITVESTQNKGTSFIIDLPKGA